MSLAPFLHLLDEEVQFCGNHIRLLDGMHAFRAGLVGDHLLDQFFCFGYGQVEKAPPAVASILARDVIVSPL